MGESRTKMTECESKGEWGGNRTSTQKINVLLVDDNPGKLLAHETILSELQENVITARSGEEALRHLLKEPFAVILLDVNMPGLDGFETAELIRQHPRFETTPIIFITGYNTSDLDRLKGYKLGAVDYVLLPVIPEVLKAKVEAFIKLARQRQIIQEQAEDMAKSNQELETRLTTIQKLNGELRETNQELESYTYTVSHDLRAPLRHMASFCDVLLDEYGQNLDERAQKAILGIKKAACGMDKLTTDLLEYTRIMRNHLHRQPVLVEQVVREILDSSRVFHAPNAEILMEKELLPVLANPTLLYQCLSNLLHNAVKFVAPGVVPKIRVWTQPVNEKVKIWVEDNGIGIAPAYHKKIFGLFERVGKVKEYDGTGAGLAIVSRAVKRMKGACGVESALGAGSRFWLELPSPEEPQQQNDTGASVTKKEMQMLPSANRTEPPPELPSIAQC